MRIRPLIAAIIMGALCHAALASELKIDGATKESFEKSVKTILDTLQPDEQKIFSEGLMGLIITRYPPAAGATGFDALPFVLPAVEAAHRTMNGATKSEIMARGRELKGGGSPQSKDEKQDHSAIRLCLQKYVMVSGARIERGDFSKYVRLNVTNKLAWPVAFVHIGYKVTTPGRSVPWKTEKFGMDISGGIEPGETRVIRTSLSDIPDIAKNVIVSAEVLDVADPDKRPLIGETKFRGNSKELSPLECKGIGKCILDKANFSAYIHGR